MTTSNTTTQSPLRFYLWKAFLSFAKDIILLASDKFSSLDQSSIPKTASPINETLRWLCQRQQVAMSKTLSQVKKIVSQAFRVNNLSSSLLKLVASKRNWLSLFLGRWDAGFHAWEGPFAWYIKFHQCQRSKFVLITLLGYLQYPL